MAYQQSDIDALDAAIKGGELTVRNGEKQITYRTLDEMLRVRRLMVQDVQQPAASRAYPRHQLADFSDS